MKEKAIGDWLDKLEELCYDIQDLLDEWKTEIQKLQMEKVENDSKAENKVCSLIPCYHSSPRQVVRRHDIATKFKNLNQTLDNIAKDRKIL